MSSGDRRSLPGGLTNPGVVFRVGDEVRRPRRPSSVPVHELTRHLASDGLEVPQYLGIDDDGNDRVTFIQGDVPVSPFPSWSLTAEVLRAAARLLRRTHDASPALEGLDEAPWDRTFAAPRGGPVIGHNDVCPDNTVFRDGRPVAFIDYEFAAPTEPLLDLAHLTRMWAPLGVSDVDPRRADRLADRVQAVMDGYGTADVDGLAEAVGLSISQARTFVRRRASPTDLLLTDDYFERRRVELIAAVRAPRRV